MKDFRQLSVWQKAHALALAVYRQTRSFPPEEMQGLTSQLREAASSIPAKIAHGYGRGSSKELSRFLETSEEIAGQLEHYLLISSELGYLNAEAHDELSRLTVEVKQMLSLLHQKIDQDRSQDWN